MRIFGKISLVIVAVLALMSACRTSYVPVEKIVYQKMAIHDTAHISDSVLIHDSILVVQKGDTVYKDKWHTETIRKYIYKNSVDSFAKVDSIPYPVEKELTKWEKFRLEYSVWSFAALCMVILYVCFKLYRRLKNGNRNDNNQQK